MPYCSNCGNLINEGDKFCPNCGKPAKEENNQDVYINIKREKGYVAALASYKVCFTGIEVGTVSNGETKIFRRDNRQKFMLKVYPFGDSVSLHKMACEVEIDPSRCKTNTINCTVKTEKKILGFLVPLLSAPGQITIQVEYK